MDPQQENPPEENAVVPYLGELPRHITHWAGRRFLEVLFSHSFSFLALLFFLLVIIALAIKLIRTYTGLPANKIYEHAVTGTTLLIWAILIKLCHIPTRHGSAVAFVIHGVAAMILGLVFHVTFQVRMDDIWASARASGNRTQILVQFIQDDMIIDNGDEPINPENEE